MKRTLARSKSVHSRSPPDFYKDEDDTETAPKRIKITEESLNNDFNELMSEIVAISTAPKPLPKPSPKILNELVAALKPIPERKPNENVGIKATSATVSIVEPQTIVAKASTSQAGPSGMNIGGRGLKRSKPVLINAVPPVQSMKLTMPFASKLNKQIEWDNKTRIGSLPNAVLSFECNEFGMIELHEKPTNIGANKPKQPNKKGDLLLNQCEHTNFDVCFNAVLIRWGDVFWMNQTTPMEYHSNEFKEVITKCIKKHNGKCDLVSLNDIYDEMSLSKQLQTAACLKTYQFDWNTYLSKYNSINPQNQLFMAPLRLFFNQVPKAPNPFLVGQKLEAIDPKNCSLFCVCTVVEVRGYRIKLHFDGYHFGYDFWTNADSNEIFPINWSRRTGRELQLPPGSSQSFKWNEYLNRTNSVAATESAFQHPNSSVSMEFVNVLYHL